MRKRGTIIRAQLDGRACGRLFGGRASSVPFYKRAVADQSLAPRCQSRITALRREVPAAGGAGLDLRRELHQVVAGHPASVPHAGASGHAPGPMGQDQRPLRARHRAGTRLPQGYERRPQRRSAIRPSHGCPDAISSSTTAASREGRAIKKEAWDRRASSLGAVVPPAPRKPAAITDRRAEGGGSLPQERQADRGLHGGLRSI